jgi:hypothetical protein
MTVVRILAIVAVMIAAPTLARAQSASTPILDPDRSLPIPTIGRDEPHALEGRPLIGASVSLGFFARTPDPHAIAIDAWAGFGLTDRLAVLAYVQGTSAKRSGQYGALGVGVRGWPFASVPSLSVEGRLGVAYRPTSLRDDPRYQGNDGYDHAGTAGGAAIFDVVRTRLIGLELRTSLTIVGGEYQGTEVVGLVGLGATFY